MKKPKRPDANEVRAAINLVLEDLKKSIEKRTKKYKWSAPESWSFRARICNIIFAQHYHIAFHSAAKNMLKSEMTEAPVK